LVTPSSSCVRFWATCFLVGDCPPHAALSGLDVEFPLFLRTFLLPLGGGIQVFCSFVLPSSKLLGTELGDVKLFGLLLGPFPDA